MTGIVVSVEEEEVRIRKKNMVALAIACLLTGEAGIQCVPEGISWKPD